MCNIASETSDDVPLLCNIMRSHSNKVKICLMNNSLLLLYSTFSVLFAWLADVGLFRAVQWIWYESRLYTFHLFSVIFFLLIPSQYNAFLSFKKQKWYIIINETLEQHKVCQRRRLKFYDHNLLNKKSEGTLANAQTNNRASPPTLVAKNKSNISCFQPP